jgi:hypothetical protein
LHDHAASILTKDANTRVELVKELKRQIPRPNSGAAQ